MLCAGITDCIIAFSGEEFPENILQATAKLNRVNIIPAIGKLVFIVLVLNSGFDRLRSRTTDIYCVCLCGMY